VASWAPTGAPSPYSQRHTRPGSRSAGSSDQTEPRSVVAGPKVGHARAPERAPSHASATSDRGLAPRAALPACPDPATACSTVPKRSLATSRNDFAHLPERRLWSDAPREGLDPVEERVGRGRTALGPLREAVAARAAVGGRDIDRARRAALDDLGLDADALQWAVVQRGRDGRPRALAPARAPRRSRGCGASAQWSSGRLVPRGLARVRVEQ
jgi:hypothetical protein